MEPIKLEITARTNALRLAMIFSFFVIVTVIFLYQNPDLITGNIIYACLGFVAVLFLIVLYAARHNYFVLIDDFGIKQNTTFSAPKFISWSSIVDVSLQAQEHNLLLKIILSNNSSFISKMNFIQRVFSQFYKAESLNKDQNIVKIDVSSLKIDGLSVSKFESQEILNKKLADFVSSFANKALLEKNSFKKKYNYFYIFLILIASFFFIILFLYANNTKII